MSSLEFSFSMMLWLHVPTSNNWANSTWCFCWGLWLLTAAVTAAGAAVATVAAARATTLMTAAAAGLAAVTAAAAWLATVAATVMTTITTAAFLGSLSSFPPKWLSAVCLLHYGCNCQDTWVICHLGYSCLSWLGAWTAIAVASLSAVFVTNTLFCIISIPALTLLRLDTFLRFTRWRTIVTLFLVVLALFHILFGAIAVFWLCPLLFVCWYFTGALICICAFLFICSKKW